METTSTECVFGKVCKNLHGLKIHQAKMKCMQMMQVSQRSGTTPGRTQESPHSEVGEVAPSLQGEGVAPV